MQMTSDNRATKHGYVIVTMMLDKLTLRFGQTGNIFIVLNEWMCDTVYTRNEIIEIIRNPKAYFWIQTGRIFPIYSSRQCSRTIDIKGIDEITE